MQKMYEVISGLPWAVWLIVSIAIVVGIIYLAKYGKQRYGLRFIFTLSMLFGFLSWMFLIAGIFLYDDLDSAAKTNDYINSLIVFSIGIFLFAIAATKNIKSSNFLFGTFFTIVQVLTSFTVFFALSQLTSKKKSY